MVGNLCFVVKGKIHREFSNAFTIFPFSPVISSLDIHSFKRADTHDKSRLR